MNHPVFVYGSLMSGQPNHHLLSGAESVGPDRTQDRAFRMVDVGGFPAADTGGREWVHGELYRVDDATLARLDRLEGHPTLYRRRRVRLGWGEDAWIYLSPKLAARGDRPTVPDGDWSEYLANTKRKVI
jgi:gamma-glutamylaminecyclotransferase